MEEKKEIKINLSTIFLVFTLIIIVVMTYFIIRLSTEKKLVEEKFGKLSEQISNLENTSYNLQEKIDLISSKVNISNGNNNAVSLDSYILTDYGIHMSSSSTFIKLADTSLNDNSVETFTDNKGNSITITMEDNPLDTIINNTKNLTTPDGTLFNHNIKEIGNIRLNSGITGYRMEMVSNGDNVIKFIAPIENPAFTVSFVIHENYDEYLNLYNKMIDSISFNPTTID